MKKFDKIFGAGPKGLLLSLVLFFITGLIARQIHLPILANDLVRILLFAVLAAVSLLLIVWSVTSLNPKMRGEALVTTGAFRYFRHPLYAAFLTFFDFGLAVLLNNWLFIIWALLLHPLWHWNIVKEEAMLKNIFPKDYEGYCGRTGRFFPKLY